MCAGNESRSKTNTRTKNAFKNVRGRIQIAEERWQEFAWEKGIKQGHVDIHNSNGWDNEENHSRNRIARNNYTILYTTISKNKSTDVRGCGACGVRRKNAK